MTIVEPLRALFAEFPTNNAPRRTTRPTLGDCRGFGPTPGYSAPFGYFIVDIQWIWRDFERFVGDLWQFIWNLKLI